MGLRNYQQETLDVLVRMEKKYGNFSTVVNLPTGAGKTPIAVQLCKDVVGRGDSKVLWLADKRVLLTQSQKDFEDSSIKCQILFDKVKFDAEESKDKKFAQDVDIVFATIGGMVSIYDEENESFIKWVGNNKLYVIYEEAHHIGESQAFNLFTSLFASESDDKAVKYFYQIKNFAIVGFTATVYRGDNFVDAFKAFFKDGYCKEHDTLYHSDSEYGDFIDVDIQSIDEIRVAVADINELIEGYEGAESVLVEPQLIKVDEFMDGMLPKSEDENVSWNMEYLANRIKANKGKWGKLAVVVNGITEAKILKDLLFPNAIIWTSKESSSKEEIDSFIEGKQGDKVLITVHKFDEGVDVPDLDTLYLFAKTNSHIILRQRIGRVIRKNIDNPDKIAKVIWQAYPEEEKYLSDKGFKKLLKKSYEYKVQTPEEMQNDYEAWMKNNKLQLPAIMYRKPLRADFINNYSAWMLFRAEEVFGTEVLSQAKSAGFFFNSDEYDSTEDVIFVTNVEYEGYLQLQHLLQSDWLSKLRYSDACESFEDYASKLKIDEKELLEDIKKVCFYQQIALRSDSGGKKLSKRVFVNDGDIKTFCKWFFSGYLAYHNLYVRKEKNSETTLDEKLLKFLSSEEYKETEYKCDTSEEKLRELIHNIERLAKKDKEQHHEKVYTELLRYGEGKHTDNYQEMLSKKFMMRAGITDVLPRIVIELEDGKSIDAFAETKHVKRKSNVKINREDWILYASALVEIPNHINISQSDVNEYEMAVKQYLLQNVETKNQEQAVKECLLALGYRDNDNIIRYQCKNIGVELPKILQYVIFQKCYIKLAKEVEFVKNDVSHSECMNEKALRDMYDKQLAELGVQASQIIVNPVDAVIYDYRPYLKAVYYYQGIKPEFLCRMANDIFSLSKTKVERIVDGFGGSGAYSMNAFYRNMQPGRIYNDLGLMNTSFYRCLKSEEKRKALIEQIQAIIDEAFSNKKDDYRIAYLLDKYDSFMTDYSKKLEDEKKKPLSMSYWGETLEKAETRYKGNYDDNVDKYRKKHPDEISYRNVKLEDRLHMGHSRLLDAGIEESTIRNVERYFHVFMLQLNPVYLAVAGIFEKEELKQYQISDIDLAVLFFFYNTLSHRHFYNDCTIGLISKMVSNYKQWLGYGAECFERVEVEQEDALELLTNEKYNVEGTDWYLDIPYAETSSSDYVAQWFDTGKFISGLSQLKGHYLVSSRSNICLPNQQKLEYIETPQDFSDAEIIQSDNEKIDHFDVMPNKYNKEFNVFEFFASFLPEGDELSGLIEGIQVKKIVKKKVKNEDDMEEEVEVEEEQPICVEHISESKKATYIVIPYTKMSEEYYEEDGKIKKRRIEGSALIDEDYVRRMLASTQYTNIPVDIMVTDIDIDIDNMPVRPTYKADGNKSKIVYVLPTFKTGIDATQYMTEPAVIIMDYRAFMRVFISLMYHDEWKKYENSKKELENATKAKDLAAMFRNMFD